MNKSRCKKLRALFEQSFGHTPNTSEFRLYKKVYVKNKYVYSHDIFALNQAYIDNLTYQPAVMSIPLAIAAINKLKINSMTYTRDIIAIIIVLALVASLFVVTNSEVAKVLFGLVGIIIGFYFGKEEVPVVSVYKNKKLGKLQGTAQN